MIPDFFTYMALLPRKQPSPIQMGAIPWVLRGLVLLPLLQIGGVVETFRMLGCWHREPERRPSRGRLWGIHILPPITLNLIPVTSGLALLISGLLGFFYTLHARPFVAGADQWQL